MAQRAEIREGKVRYDGRTLAEWVPDVVNDVVRAANPVRVFVIGSVARGDDGPDSDLDLLVELDAMEPGHKVDRMVEVRRAIRAPVPVDVLVTDAEDLSARGDLPGILRVALREGQVVYARPG